MAEDELIQKIQATGLVVGQFEKIVKAGGTYQVLITKPYKQFSFLRRGKQLRGQLAINGSFDISCGRQFSIGTVQNLSSLYPKATFTEYRGFWFATKVVSPVAKSGVDYLLANVSFPDVIPYLRGGWTDNHCRIAIGVPNNVRMSLHICLEGCSCITSPKADSYNLPMPGVVSNAHFDCYSGSPWVDTDLKPNPYLPKAWKRM